MINIQVINIQQLMMPAPVRQFCRSFREEVDMKPTYGVDRFKRLLLLLAISVSLATGTRPAASVKAQQGVTQPSTILYLPMVTRGLLPIGLGLAGRKNSPAVDGNLPGGTSISVDITAPGDGAVKVFPPGSIDLEGTASVAEGVIVKDTTVVYVMDISDSMNSSSGVDCDGLAGNDSRLVCEKEAVKAANAAAKAATSSVDQTGLGSFEGDFNNQICISTAHDVDLGTAGSQLLVDPGLDGNSNGTADIEEVAAGLSTGGATCYIGGLQKADEILASSTNAINLIFFMSDGFNNTGANVSTFTPSNFGSNTRIHAFAMGLGTAVDCSTDNFGKGSLNDVVAKSTLAGGTCQQVTDLSQLADLITSALGSSLVSIERQLDGGPFVDISASASPPIPRDGPTGVVTFNEAGINAAPGIHQLCVRANGVDGGGAGSVTKCIQVTVATINLLPKTAVNELGASLPQTHTVTATVEAGTDGGVGNVQVNFKILSGPNAGATGSALTDGNGEATFTYTAVQGPTGLGTDVIQACFGPDEQGDTACDTAQKEWVDTTPPTVNCVETVNPGGENVPPAQNEDGFYKLVAEDAVDPNPQISLVDTGADNAFGTADDWAYGPFSNGTQIKYTEANGITPPDIKPGAGAIDWKIKGQGDAAVTAVDASGNASAPVSCPVPPPPK